MIFSGCFFDAHPADQVDLFGVDRRKRRRCLEGLHAEPFDLPDQGLGFILDTVMTIRLPPLRERGGDIGLLAQFFLKKFSGQMGKRIRGLAPEALELLARYHWPGNIRELENTLERAVLMADGELVSAEDLALFSQAGAKASGAATERTVGEAQPGEAGADRLSPTSGPTPEPAVSEAPSAEAGLRLQDSERRLVLEALQACGWVQKEAARRLGLSSRALNYRIRKLGITHPGWRQNKG